MNTSIKAIFERHIYKVTKEKEDFIKGLALLTPLVDRLSENIQTNLLGGSFWFYVNNRTDLMLLMTLSPEWYKETQTVTVDYTATIDNIPFRILARDDALPDTCRLVKKQVVVPARPEYTEERLVVECNTP